MWPRLAALIVKELLATFRDPRGRFALIVPPILQLFLYAYAATLEVKNVPVGVLNEDSGLASQQLISRFERVSAFSEILSLRSLNEARAAIDSQQAMTVALSVARERELGTFEQLLVSPLQPMEIVLGKTVPGVLVGLIQGTLIIAVTVGVFGIPLRGSL